MSFEERFNELNFDVLPGQTNIYGVTLITRHEQNGNKILVALVEGRIFVCEYTRSSVDQEINRFSREVTFTYIPGKCHIISMDSFSCAARGLIIGVTFCKHSTDNFFNIYCNYGDDVPSGQEFNLDTVAQNCRSFDLSFTPFQLTHSKVTCPADDEQRTVFILLGSDGRFHVYAQGKSDAEFGEEPVEKYFIELSRTYCMPMYLEIYNISENKRVTVFGCAKGEIYAFLVDCQSNNTMACWEVCHDSPISQLQLFQDSRYDDVHLVVVSARELAVVYRGLLKNGFSDQLVLAESDTHGCSTCCTVYDINHNGKKEVLIGTYGKKVLAYAFDITCKVHEPISTLEFAFPVLKLKFVDMTGDYLEEMVVISTKGVHMFQSNLGHLLQKCKANLKHLIK